MPLLARATSHELPSHLLRHLAPSLSAWPADQAGRVAAISGRHVRSSVDLPESTAHADDLRLRFWPGLPGSLATAAWPAAFLGAALCRPDHVQRLRGNGLPGTRIRAW